MIHLALLLVAAGIVALAAYILVLLALWLLLQIVAPFVMLALDALTWFIALAQHLRRH